MLCYSTEGGNLYGWDTRSPLPVFTLPHARSLGLMQASPPQLSFLLSVLHALCLPSPPDPPSCPPLPSCPPSPPDLPSLQSLPLPTPALHLQVLPPIHQAITADANANWLVGGSSSGQCVLWDLRYSLKLRSWQIPDRKVWRR